MSEYVGLTDCFKIIQTTAMGRQRQFGRINC